MNLRIVKLVCVGKAEQPHHAWRFLLRLHRENAGLPISGLYAASVYTPSLPRSLIMSTDTEQRVLFDRERDEDRTEVLTGGQGIPLYAKDTRFRFSKERLHPLRPSFTPGFPIRIGYDGIGFQFASEQNLTTPPIAGDVFFDVAVFSDASFPVPPGGFVALALPEVRG